jgi:hypothetical protein
MGQFSSMNWKRLLAHISGSVDQLRAAWSKFLVSPTFTASIARVFGILSSQGLCD